MAFTSLAMTSLLPQSIYLAVSNLPWATMGQNGPNRSKTHLKAVLPLGEAVPARVVGFAIPFHADGEPTVVGESTLFEFEGSEARLVPEEAANARVWAGRSRLSRNLAFFGQRERHWC